MKSCGQRTPCRCGDREGGQAARSAPLGRRAAGGTRRRDGGRLHLRAGAGGAEPGPHVPAALRPRRWQGRAAMSFTADIPAAQREAAHAEEAHRAAAAARPVRFTLDGREVTARPPAKASGRSPAARATPDPAPLPQAARPDTAPTATAAPAWSRSKGSGTAASCICAPAPAWWCARQLRGRRGRGVGAGTAPRRPARPRDARPEAAASFRWTRRLGMEKNHASPPEQRDRRPTPHRAAILVRLDACVHAGLCERRPYRRVPARRRRRHGRAPASTRG